MPDADIARQAQASRPGSPHTPATFPESAAGGEWIASSYEDVCAVLADERFEVPAPEETGAPGTISWFRASVCRFCNGAEHQLRRARVVEALQLLEPAQLRSTAHARALAILNVADRSGARVDVMSQLARRVPMASMAGSLQIADPDGAAEAAIAMAAGYAPGADATSQPAADAATSRLVRMLAPAEMAVRIARISLMIQACDATAGLIGTALHVLQDTPDLATASSWSTDAVLTEVLRYRPVLRASRRRASAPIDFGGCAVSAGDTVVCDIDAANRDPAAFDQPDRFDPARPQQPSLTFGYGYRPCPGQPQAVMLAAGVVDAVRQRCAFLPGARVDYEASALRIPSRLDVVLS
jgi:cytochrome P450